MVCSTVFQQSGNHFDLLSLVILHKLPSLCELQELAGFRPCLYRLLLRHCHDYPKVNRSHVIGVLRIGEAHVAFANLRQFCCSGGKPDQF